MADKVEEARQGVMSLVNNIGWDTIANSLDLVPSALDALIAAVREEVERPIADALMTAERGDALVDVARNAHRAEMELAQQARRQYDF